MSNVATLLLEAQDLFIKGNHPVVVYYELGPNRLIQLLRCLTPFTNCGITLTMFVRVEGNNPEDIEFSPEFAMSMDGMRVEALIDPFGVTPDEPGFCVERDITATYLERLLACSRKAGEPR